MKLNDFDDRFLASFVLSSHDYDAQLLAIRGLLHRHKQADEDLANEMKDIAAFAQQATGLTSDQLVDDWGEHFHQSIFQDAAHSMAAVGMLAPLVESLFRRAFPGIRDFLTDRGHKLDLRARSTMSVNQQWECQFVASKRKDLVSGIFELADIVELTASLPTDLRKTLSALFAYRNCMFHNGFEWPEMERVSFRDRIANENWPSEWFNQATTDDQPWIFYMSDDFVEHCLKTVDRVIAALGAFVRQRVNFD